MAWYSDLSSEGPTDVTGGSTGSGTPSSRPCTSIQPAPVEIPMPPPLPSPPATPVIAPIGSYGVQRPIGARVPPPGNPSTLLEPLPVAFADRSKGKAAPLVATALMVAALVVGACAVAIGQGGTDVRASSSRVGSGRELADAPGAQAAPGKDGTTTSTSTSVIPAPPPAPTPTPVPANPTAPAAGATAPPARSTKASAPGRPVPARPAPAPRAPSWEEIKNASIPGLCGHPPTRLVEGRDVTLPEHAGYFQLLPIIDHGAGARGPGFVTGLTSPGGPVTAVVGSCNGGGVSWPNIIVVFGHGGVFYGTHDLMAGINWDGAGMAAPGRDGVTSITQAGGRLVVNTSAEYAMEPSCCPTGFATITLAVVDHALAVVDFKPSVQEDGC